MSAKRRITRFKADVQTRLFKQEGRRLGVVVTPHGNVFVYATDSWTMFSFVWREYKYTMSEDKGHSDRGLATLAGRFVRAVMNGLTESA